VHKGTELEDEIHRSKSTLRMVPAGQLAGECETKMIPDMQSFETVE
jgi:hypothetical protein